MLRSLCIVCFIALPFISCIEQPNSFSQLPPGEWRGILKLTDPDVVVPVSEETSESLKDYFELPFNFEVAYDAHDEMMVYLLNGEERIKVEEVFLGRDPRTAKDTLQMNFTAFDTHIDGFYEENFIEGRWYVNYKDDYSIPLIAYYGQNHRFDTKGIKEAYDFEGKWQVEFSYETEKSYPAIAVFQQNGTELTGTFETETGDYRYLEGNAFGNKLRLSVFDGSHAFLFRAEVQNDTIYGEFRSGNHYKTRWKAFRTDSFNLRDPYHMSKVAEQNVNFRLPDINGDTWDFGDHSSDTKIKLINIMGTWCPNCKDELQFLKEIRDQYSGEDLSIISIAFEKYKDQKDALSIMKKYQESIGFDWPFLLGGTANKAEASDKLSFIDRIYAFPTLLVVDQNNIIVDIHTGFYGPATTKYEIFKEEFISKIDQLIKE